MSVKLFVTFLKRHLQESPEDIRPEKTNADEVAELLWPLLRPFQGKVAAEPAVDAALEKWAQSAGAKLPALPPLAQRILLERVRQSLIAIQAHAAAGELLLVPPRSLSAHHRHVAAAMLWLHEMELPYPVEAHAVH